MAAALVTAKLGAVEAAWPGLAAPLLARLTEVAPQVDVVTWVTTPRARARHRGADHARTLGRLVAARLELPAVPLLSARPSSSGRDRYRALCRLPGTDVLLVDDILTTGATAWRAGGCLRAAGAGRLHLAVLARAGTHALGAVER